MKAPLALTPTVNVLHSGDGLLVRTGEQVHTLTGEKLCSLVAELLAQVNQGVVPAPAQESEAWNRLEELLEISGMVVREEGLAQADPGVRMLWQRSGRPYPVSVMQAALSAARIPLLGSHTLVPRIASILEENGVETVDNPALARASDAVEGSVAPAIVVVDSPHDPRLTKHNEWALETGAPWLPVVIDDAGRSVVGPYIQPRSSACARCYQLRRAANFSDRRIVGPLSEADPVPLSPLPVDLMGLGWFVAALACEKVVERVVLGAHATMTCPGSMAVVERTQPGVSVDEHRVLRVPRCPACSPTVGQGLPQVWHHGGGRA